MKYPSIERQIATALIKDILAQGCKIELFAEGESICNPTSQENLLLTEMACCDMMELVVTQDGERKGWFMLIWGNGEDILSDFTDNAFCEAIWERIKPE